MMEKYIKQIANELITELLNCDDGDFVDEVIARVAMAEPFDLDE